MFDVFSIMMIIIAISITIWLIQARVRDYRKSEMKKLASLGKVKMFKISLFFNLVAFIAYLGTFIFKTNNIYQILEKGYLNNILQLFSITHLDKLTEYFYEQEMLSKYLVVNNYRHEFLFLIVTIVIEFCVIIYSFYIMRTENIIQSEGLLLNSRLIPWETIKSYQWTDKKKFFSKEQLKTLTIRSNSDNPLTFERTQTIDVSKEKKRTLDYYLRRMKVKEK